ncbi:NACHT domain-containing protein [Fusarium sp. LHS14.1]|nr:NACHT domain-containing protein [Fusarium sp. LHS14.1]
MSAQPTDNGQPASRQEIHNVFATNGGISLAGNFKGCTIGGIQHLTTQEKIARCRHSLFVSHPKIDRATLASSKGQRVPGTCEWIRKNSHYKTWLAGESRLLWISGGPGRGKTVLSLFLNEEVEKLCKKTQDRLLFYFCQFQDERHNNPINVLRSLIYQILDFSIDGPEVQKALEYFDTPEKVQFALSSFECLWTVLETLFEQSGLPKVFCIIDGVDECYPSRQLVAKLYDCCRSQARSNDGGGLRLAMIGREIDGLDAFPGIKVDPDNEESVNEDVKTLISSSLEPLARIPGFNDIRSPVEKLLLKRAEGIFLWVSFVVDELSRKKTCVEILHTIRSLPKGLYPIFARMLHQIGSDQRQISSQIFEWVALAERPLTLDELTAVIEAESRDPDMPMERIIADRVAICRPFLKVHDNQVLFVHQSAKEYLLRKHHDTDQVLEGFRITSGQGHAALAHKCLLVLENSALQDTYLSFRNMPWQGESHLLGYAILHWQSHARLASRDAEDLFNSDRTFYKQPSVVQSNWMKTYSRYHENHLRNLPQTSLHIASYFAIVPWVRIALDWDRSTPRGIQAWLSRKTINSIDNGWTPLQWAVLGGDEGTVRTLLDSGADINARDGLNETALVGAVRQGCEPIVRLLLKRGADVNATTKHEDLTLLHARRHGDSFASIIIPRKGFDFHTFLTYNATALIEATYNGNSKMVRLLLDSATSPDLKTRQGIQALTIAVFMGDKSISRLLLDRGVSLKGRYEPLNCAASSKHEGMVPLLLEYGADVNLGGMNHDSKGLIKMTPLICAARHGRDRAVRLLLERGADANARAIRTFRVNNYPPISLKRWIWEYPEVKKSGSAIVHAAKWGHTTTVQLLLDHGVDISITDEYGRRALECAAQNGFKEIKELLLRYKRIVRDILLAPDNDDAAVPKAIKRFNEQYVADFAGEDFGRRQPPEYAAGDILNEISIAVFETVGKVSFTDIRHDRLANFLIGLKRDAADKFNREDPQFVYFGWGLEAAAAEDWNSSHAQGTTTDNEFRTASQASHSWANYILIAGDAYIKEVKQPSKKYRVEVTPVRWKLWASKLQEVSDAASIDAEWDLKNRARKAYEKMVELYPEAFKTEEPQVDKS